jgi:hypothetical protein
MKRYTQQHIQDLLDKFMNGLTTLEEEAALGDYFRTHEMPEEWEDYRQMFGYFDRGMEGELITPQAQEQPFMRLMGRRWWGIAAAAAIAALIIGATVVYHPTSTTQPVVAEVAQKETQEQTTPIGETQEQATPIGETQNFASLQTTPEQPVETQNLASQTAAVKTSHKRKSNVRRLQAENAKLAQENERLQRELADLRRRAFIIDLEANGYKTVMNEDGSIVLIDLEQELENELNNQPTSNIPAL